jgi:hypothetical protein
MGSRQFFNCPRLGGSGTTRGGDERLLGGCGAAGGRNWREVVRGRRIEPCELGCSRGNRGGRRSARRRARQEAGEPFMVGTGGGEGVSLALQGSRPRHGHGMG